MTAKSTNKKQILIQKDNLMTKPINLMEEITLFNGEKINKDFYVKSKTKDLIEFGYKGLTEAEVLDQVNKILEGGQPLSIIGHFCVKDIKLNDQ